MRGNLVVEVATTFQYGVAAEPGVLGDEVTCSNLLCSLVYGGDIDTMVSSCFMYGFEDVV